MNNNHNERNSSELINHLVKFFKMQPNPKKKGELSEMILKDDFHNKNQSEEDYQIEQEAWLSKIKNKKKGPNNS